MKARTFAVDRAIRTRKNIFIKLSRSARVICLFVQLCNWQYISVLLGLAFSRIFFSISLRRESRGGLKVLFGGDSTRGAPINGRLEACMLRSRASFERVAHLIFDLQQQQLNWPLPHKCCSRECTSKKRKDEVQRDLWKNKKPRVASKEKKFRLRIYEDSACKSRRREQFKLVGNAREHIDCGVGFFFVWTRSINQIKVQGTRTFDVLRRRLNLIFFAESVSFNKTWL